MSFNNAPSRRESCGLPRLAPVTMLGKVVEDSGAHSPCWKDMETEQPLIEKMDRGQAVSHRSSLHFYSPPQCYLGLVAQRVWRSVWFPCQREGFHRKQNGLMLPGVEPSGCHQGQPLLHHSYSAHPSFGLPSPSLQTDRYVTPR